MVHCPIKSNASDEFLPNRYRTVLYDCYEYERVQVRALDTYVYSIAHAWGTVRCRTVCIVDSAAYEYSNCPRTGGESIPKISINTLHQIRPNNRYRSCLRHGIVRCRTSIVRRTLAAGWFIVYYSYRTLLKFGEIPRHFFFKSYIKLSKLRIILYWRLCCCEWYSRAASTVLYYGFTVLVRYCRLLVRGGIHAENFN